MQWSKRSKYRIAYDQVNYYGNWHEVFVWTPKKVNEVHGICTMAMLRKVMRKYNISDGGVAYFKRTDVYYMLPEDLTHAILEADAEKGKPEIESIKFDCYESKSTYRDMVSLFDPDQLKHYPEY